MVTVAIGVIVEFFDVPDASAITSLGMVVTGESRRFNIVYGEGTAAQIRQLSLDERVRNISYAAPVEQA